MKNWTHTTDTFDSGDALFGQDIVLGEDEQEIRGDVETARALIADVVAGGLAGDLEENDAYSATVSVAEDPSGSRTVTITVSRVPAPTQGADRPAHEVAQPAAEPEPEPEAAAAEPAPASDDQLTDVDPDAGDPAAPGAGGPIT